MTRIVLVSVLAASAGIHSALAASHGHLFVVAAALLAAAAAAIALRPSRAAACAAGLLLSGLLAAYVLEHGLQGDPVALATKAVEAVGVLLAARLALVTAVRRERLTILVAAAMIAVLAAAATPAVEHGHPAGTPAHGH